MFKKVLPLLVSLAFATALAAPQAFADDAPPAISDGATPIVGDEGGPSNDELFEQYISRAFDKEKLPVVRLVAQSISDSQKGYARLKGSYSRAVYAEMLEHIKAIAAGKETSAEFNIPVSTFIESGYLKPTYSAAELGVDYIYDSEKSGWSSEAMNKMSEMLTGCVADVHKALMQDCPYELFWHDRTRGMISGGTDYSAKWDSATSQFILNIEDTSLTLKYSVSQDYAAEKQDGSYEQYITNGKFDKVRTAASNAAGIVSAHADESDYAKLDSYRSEICERVTYDSSAADDSTNTPYGDPWQLISVFDGDETTNVVCEGYSKAFKFLCDKTDFDDPTIACYTAPGLMGTSASRVEDMTDD